jgi:predicted Fe-Mo cluster-binding NifX family protein
MRVAVSAAGAGLEAPLGVNFARCRHFAFVDVDTLECESVENPWADALSGAGSEVAKMLGMRQVEAVITGAIGPNAFSGLQAVGIPVFVAQDGTVKSAVQAYRAAHLPFLVAPNSGPRSPFSREGQAHANLAAGGHASRPRRRAGKVPGETGGEPDELAGLLAQVQGLAAEVRTLRERIGELEQNEKGSS